jgi:hypothetical protein
VKDTFNSKWIKDLNIRPETKITLGSSRKFTGTEMYREQFPKQNSKGSASKRKNEQMGLHQTEELLHSKGNSSQTQMTAHRMEENLCPFDEGLMSRVYRELKKLNLQRINTPMKKWVHELGNFQRKR